MLRPTWLSCRALRLKQKVALLRSLWQPTLPLVIAIIPGAPAIICNPVISQKLRACSFTLPNLQQKLSHANAIADALLQNPDSTPSAPAKAPHHRNVCQLQPSACFIAVTVSRKITLVTDTSR